MFTLGIILGAIVYLNIGYRWSRISWKAWHEWKFSQEKQHSVAKFLCFPASYMGNRIGVEKGAELADAWGIADFEQPNNYANGMVFLWPGKLAVNLVTIAVLGFVLGGKFIGENSIKLLTNPRSFFPKRPPKALVQEPPKELPAAEPDHDQFNIDEYNSLRARLDKLEAHPDKEKILAQARRF